MMEYATICDYMRLYATSQVSSIYAAQAIRHQRERLASIYAAQASTLLKQSGTKGRYRKRLYKFVLIIN